MKIVEFAGHPPEVAGKAKIEYLAPKELTEEEREPHRSGTTIFLPHYADLELFELQKDWNQFLVVYSGDVWFGGTDENPFLVRMDRAVLPDYYHGGPEGFYNAIVPERITKFVGMLGVPYKRQGDIFAIPCPYDWAELSKANMVFRGKELEIGSVKDLSVFGTRHILKGTTMFSTVTLLGVDGVHIAEGKISAPDHSPITLSGPHIISQTAKLHDPKVAD